MSNSNQDKPVTVSVVLPNFMYNDLCKILSKENPENFSDLARRGIRREIMLYKAREAKDFVKFLDKETKQAILNELKKDSD